MKVRILQSVLATSLLLVASFGTALASSLDPAIEAAEQTFNGEAFSASAVGRFVDVEVLSGNQVVEALYDAETVQLAASEIYGSPRRVQRVQAAVDQAVLSLVDAIAAAEAAVGPGDVLEAELLLSRRNPGSRYLVDIRTADGIFDVVVDSATGQIIRIVRD